MIYSTAKGLAALIHQKHIVTDLFADALYSALTSIEDILDPDSLPDPMEFLPSTDEYSADVFRPNPARAELFKGLAFIFLDEGQYNNLVAPINAGHGKAIVFDVNGKKVEDLLEFVRNKGQVLLIQRNLEEEDTFCIEAAKRFVCKRILIKRLGYESITQSGLLAPVLRVDRSLLLRPVEASQRSNTSTARHTTPDSSNTMVAPPIEIPDSVERPSTHSILGDEMDTDIPPPITKKVLFLTLRLILD